MWERFSADQAPAGDVALKVGAHRQQAFFFYVLLRFGDGFCNLLTVCCDEGSV
jgi:hypothetical protein